MVPLHTDTRNRKFPLKKSSKSALEDLSFWQESPVMILKALLHASTEKDIGLQCQQHRQRTRQPSVKYAVTDDPKTR